MMVEYEESGNSRIVELTDSVDAADFEEVCERIRWDEEARVVVIVFPGKMRDPGGQSTPVEQISKIAQPVIAAIRGDATGFGLELALACDIRIAADDARFGFPEIAQSQMPCHGGTQRLPRLIGQGRAIQMLLTGDLVNAAEALRIGLIHRSVASDRVIGTSLEMANEMSGKSPLSLSYAKEALNSGRDLTLDQGLRMELDLYLLLFSTADRTEGVKAFREKRKPRFEGS